ncbi:MAG: response regulator [Candidatus Eisenbacteria sp.]|nr:response regulator [Candidatus Eisenbacteria bacterium]
MKTVLVVEDDESLRMLYEKELSDEGYRVLVVESGNAALDIIWKESCDAVILDIKMERPDGLEVLSRIKEKKRDMPVIINTAYSTYKGDFGSWAADAYVVKSSDLTELKEAVRRFTS